MVFKLLEAKDIFFFSIRRNRNFIKKSIFGTPINQSLIPLIYLTFLYRSA